jgi:hypothetical protein
MLTADTHQLGTARVARLFFCPKPDWPRILVINLSANLMTKVSNVWLWLVLAIVRVRVRVRRDLGTLQALGQIGTSIKACGGIGAQQSFVLATSPSKNPKEVIQRTAKS